MEYAQHTPGPWTFEMDEQKTIYIVPAKAPAVWVARLNGHHAPDKANARLIAFAPDLYDLAYWIVNGDPRQSNRERVEGVKRRAAEILRRMGHVQ